MKLESGDRNASRFKAREAKEGNKAHHESTGRYRSTERRHCSTRFMHRVFGFHGKTVLINYIAYLGLCLFVSLSPGSREIGDELGVINRWGVIR
jgi:hypothetical protein